SGSIGTANRTRAIGHPRAPRDLSLSTSSGSALRVPAGVALHAALFEDEGLAALRALGIQAFLQELRGVARLLLQLDVRLDSPAEFVERLDWRLHARLLHPDVPLDRLRDRVGDRVHALGVVDRDPRTADSFELVDDLVDREARAQAEGDEPCDAFREGGRVTASAADLREDLEQAVLVLVDGHVERAVAREDLLRSARDHVGPRPRARDDRFRRDLDPDLLLLLGFRDADVQDLILPRSVAVHGDAFAMQLVG